MSNFHSFRIKIMASLDCLSFSNAFGSPPAIQPLDYFVMFDSTVEVSVEWQDSSIKLSNKLQQAGCEFTLKLVQTSGESLQNLLDTVIDVHGIETISFTSLYMEFADEVVYKNIGFTAWLSSLDGLISYTAASEWSVTLINGCQLISTSDNSRISEIPELNFQSLERYSDLSSRWLDLSSKCEAHALRQINKRSLQAADTLSECSQSKITAGGQYRTMMFTNHQTQPEIQKLIPPVFSQLYHAAQCGDFTYKIESVQNLKNGSYASLGDSLFIDDAKKQVVLASQQYGTYQVLISARLIAQPSVSLIQTLKLQVVDCGQVSILEWQQSGLPYLCRDTNITYVKSNSSTSNKEITIQANSQFVSNKTTLSPQSNQLDDRSSTYNNTSPITTDLCASLTWSNASFGTITYILGSGDFQATALLSNRYNSTQCQTAVISVEDDWTGTKTFQSSQIASALSNNSTVNLTINSANNSERVHQKVVSVIVHMQALISYQIFQATAEIVLIDPCFENHVLGLNLTDYPLAQQRSLSSNQVDYVSSYYNISNFCGLFTASIIACDGYSQENATLGTSGQVIITFDWNKNLIGSLVQCQIQYYSGIYQQTWSGQQFSFYLTDPCKDESQMYFSGQNSIVFSEPSSHQYQLCQNETLIITFSYLQDPISVASKTNDFCGLPTFRFYEYDEEYNNPLNYLFEYQFVDIGVVQMKLKSRLCDKGLTKLYQGWLDRFYSNNTFQTDYSSFLQFNLTDPCTNTVLPVNQNFFDKTSYTYLVDEPLLYFNLSAGYVQDSASITAGIDFYCGLPSLSIEVQIGPDWYPASESQLNWISLQSSSNQTQFNQSLQVFTSSINDINTYKVSLKIQLQNQVQSYGPTSFTVTDDSSCTSQMKWSDVDFGSISYQVGEADFKVVKNLQNSLSLEVCRTQVVGFHDQQNQALDWLGFVQNGTKTVSLTILKQTTTNKSGFWVQPQPWIISFIIDLRSLRYENVTFKAVGTITLTNPCFVNKISALQNFTFPISSSVNFTPDLSQLTDNYSQTPGLCGPFQLSSIQCSQGLLAEAKFPDNQVILPLNWNKTLIGLFQCFPTYQPVFRNTFKSLVDTFRTPNEITWPGDGFYITILNPCTQLPQPKIFNLTQYSTYAFNPPLRFNFSYLAENVPDWLQIVQFCGSPYYEIRVLNSQQSSTVFCTCQQLNRLTFVQPEYGITASVGDYTGVQIYSDKFQDIGTYVIRVSVWFPGYTSSNSSDQAGLQIYDACFKSTLASIFNFTNLNYTLGSTKVIRSFNYTADSISAKFLATNNVQDQCGDHLVSCSNTTFFRLWQNITESNDTYYYSIYSNSTIDVGYWRIRCQAALVKYPTVKPVIGDLFVNITKPIVQDTSQVDCIGSSDPKSCVLFIKRSPPYLSKHPASSSQFKNPDQIYELDIVNVYVQFANNITLSTVQSDIKNQNEIDTYLVIEITAQDPQFQENIGKVISKTPSTKALTFGLYCPLNLKSNVVQVLISLRWRGVDSINTTYQLPIYCMPCDQKFCSNSSYNFYATRSDWATSYHPPQVVCGTACQEQTPVQETIVQEAPVYNQQVQFSSASVQPINKNDTSVLLPDGSGSYLDYKFNSLVPVKTAKGEIVQVKMCAPSIKTISNTGLITIEFSKPIIPISQRLYSQVLLSGIIQLQLILGTEKSQNNADAVKKYGFNLTIAEITQKAVFLQLNFTNPEAISASSSSQDKIQISFVNSGRFFRCSSSLTESQSQSGRLLQNQSLSSSKQSQSADTTIPNGYRMVFPLPPQVDPDLAAKITKVVDSAGTATNTFVFSSVFVSLIFNISLSMLWGSINAVQIICCLSFNNVAWPANIKFMFDLLNQITQFDLIDPFSPIPIIDVSIYDWNWSPTDPMGNNLAIVNGGSLTFLPNLGSIALFIHLAMIQTLINPVTKLLTAIGIKGKRNILKSISADSDRLSNQWLRIFLEAFISLYMFLLLGFQMVKQIPADQRNSQDEWSVDTQFILMVPTLAFPLLIIWFAFFHSKWLVEYTKVQFYEHNQMMVEKNLKLEQKDQFIDIESGSQISQLEQSQAKKLRQQSLLQIVVENVDKEQSSSRCLIEQDNSVPKVQKSVIEEAEEIKIEIEENSPQARSVERQNESKIETLQRNGKSSSNHDTIRKSYLKSLKFSQKEVKQQQEKLDSYLKFAVLHEELNLLKQSSQYYWVIFIVRRVIFLTVCVYTNDSYIQSSVYTVSSMVSGAYMAAAFPFEDPRKNYIENFNEIIVFICGVFQMVLAGYTFDTKLGNETEEATTSRQILANLIIASVAILLIVNLYITLMDIFHQFNLECKRRYARWSSIRKMNKRKIVLQKYKNNESEESYSFSEGDDQVKQSQQESQAGSQLIENNNDQLPVQAVSEQVIIEESSDTLDLGENIDTSRQNPDRVMRLDSLIIGGGSAQQSLQSKSFARTSQLTANDSGQVQNLPTVRPKRKININNQIPDNSSIIPLGSILSDKFLEKNPPITQREQELSLMSPNNSFMGVNIQAELFIDTSRNDTDFGSIDEGVQTPQLGRLHPKVPFEQQQVLTDSNVEGPVENQPGIMRELISEQTKRGDNSGHVNLGENQRKNIKVKFQLVSSAGADYDEQLKDVSDDSDQLQYMDRVRDPLQYQENLSEDQMSLDKVSSIALNFDSSDDQDEESKQRVQAFGNDYSGDLRSSRVFKRSVQIDEAQNNLAYRKQAYDKQDHPNPKKSDLFVTKSDYIEHMREPEPEINDL